MVQLTKQHAGYAAALAAMAAGASGVYTQLEGTKTLPYKDIIGVWTVCSGDTHDVVPGVRLTQAECDQRTQNILMQFGTAVAQDSPAIVDSRLEWEAHTIFAANVGMGNYAKSSVRVLFNKGQRRNACRAMLQYDRAGGQVSIGLKNRQAGTSSQIGVYELCLGGAVSKEY